MIDLRYQNFYQILEVDPNASLEEIKRSYQFLLKTYNTDSMAIYSLFSKEEIEVILNRIDEAYKTLVDPEKRREYDRELIESGEISKGEMKQGISQGKSAISEKVIVQKEKSKPLSEEKTKLLQNLIVSFEAEEGYNGSSLQKIRELRSITLDEIAQKTKISKNYIRYIEEDRYEFLPPEVYVKGFLVQIAKVLGLNSEKVVNSYMGFFRQRRGGRKEGQDLPQDPSKGIP